MIIVPIQTFGCGDIIFTQSLVKEVAHGNRILWPVEPQFVDGLNRAYRGVTFVDRSLLNIDYNRRDEYFIGKDMRVLPIRWACENLGLPYTDCMLAKYQAYGLSWRMWGKDAMWIRDEHREQQLIKALNLPTKYNLINKYFGSQSQYQADIQIENNLPCVNMSSMNGYSIFDWVGVIIGATEIHFASSSLLYILEMLDIKAPIHIYPRKPLEQDFKNVDYIMERHRYVKHL